LSSGVRTPGEILPQGPGFRFVDEILGVEGARIRARHVVPARPSWYEDHFPGRPVMPGVLLIEMMAQAMIIHAAEVRRLSPTSVLFAAADRVRFRQPVAPGDALEVEARFIDDRGGFVRYECGVARGGAAIAEATLTGRMGS
jgi:3-hydroxyacyl-[acyl-carrier-protein] dehydratase